MWGGVAFANYSPHFSAFTTRWSLVFLHLSVFGTRYDWMLILGGYRPSDAGEERK